MNISHRLRVLLDGGEKKRGTAWFLREDLVVTALHVVADDTGQWLSDVFPNVQYRLEPKGEDPIQLAPVVADARADIAVLRSINPVAGAPVLSLAAEPLAKPGADWNTVGYPEFHHPDAFGLGGTVTAIHAGISESTVQINTREGTSIAWEGISGSPVTIESQVAGVVTRVTYGTNTLWAAPAAAVRVLLEFSQSSRFIEALAALLCDEYREPADLAHLSQPVPTEPSSYTTLAEAARSLAERAWRSGPHAFATLLARLADDHPESPRVAALQRQLAVSPGTGEGISQARLVREVMQLLSDPRSPGVALLEPLRFGARQIVEQIVDKLKESNRPELPVRLVPEPNTGDEARLYGKLQRDLRRGLEREFGRPLPPAWGDCLPTGAADGLAFEEQLEGLLDGPVKREGRVLVLVVEGFDRVAETQLPHWANMLSRLAGDAGSPLKLLVWGGADLHALCAGYRHLQLYSPFERLRRRTVGPLSAEEVKLAMKDRLGVVVNTLYKLTGRHPALVYELLEHGSAELRYDDEKGLRSRCLTGSAHLQGLKNRLETDAAALAVVRRLLGGTKEREGYEAEERLRWLGIITEEGAGHWRWAAPILEDWAGRLIRRVALLAVLVYLAGCGDPANELRDWALPTADPPGLLSNHVKAIHESPDGTLWFGTAGGMSRFEPPSGSEPGRWQTYTEKDGLAGDDVRAIHASPDGALWFGTAGGVSRFELPSESRPGRWQTYTEKDGLAENTVWAIHASADGTLWFETWGGGMSRFEPPSPSKPGRWQTYTEKDGLAGYDVRAIHESPDGALWFGTDGGGVSRFEPPSGSEPGRWQTYTEKDGLAGNSVWAIHASPDGTLWFGTDGGGCEPLQAPLPVQARALADLHRERRSGLECCPGHPRGPGRHALVRHVGRRGEPLQAPLPVQARALADLHRERRSGRE